MAQPLMQMGVLVTPYINQQGFNAMAKSQGANFAAQFQNGMARAAQPLGRITGQVSEFEKSMAAANARVLAFGASAGSIYLVKDAFEKMISSTIEVEKSLANINTILQLGQGALKTFSSEMFKTASMTGQTFQTASQVALEFARHGVSASETAKRMTSAMQLMRISGLSASESVNAITAAINAFNKEGLSSEDIVGRLTAVDTKFAVSAQDLAKAIERVGSTATEAGVKFNQLLGLVTAVQTATARGGAVIGNAFKSIFTRLARPEVLSDLEAIGITTRNASGQILPMVDLLKRLASQYNTLNYAQKSFVTEAVGGVYQVNILKAGLADLGRGFSIYDKAAIAASQSTGLIEQRMASLNDTIAAKLNTTTLQFTRLVSSFGTTGFGSGTKSGLDSFNKQIEAIGNGLDDVSEKSGFGDKIGHSLAQGVAKGLGDIVSGPGIQIAMALVTKIAKGLGSFAYQSSREFMGLNEPMKQQAAVQQSITGFLQQNVGLVNQWARGQLSLNTLVGVYLQTMKNASIAQGQMTNMVGRATPLVGGSVHAGHVAGSNFVPNFGLPNIRVGDKALSGLDWLSEQEAIKKALVREKSPTATVGFSSIIASPQNPLGALVYDKAYQKSPDDAFRQHLFLGQTDLKNMGSSISSNRFVPNFGIADSLALGALQGTFNNINGVLSPLSYHYNKQLELVRKMNEQYTALTSQIRAGGIVKYNGNVYDNKTASGGISVAQNLRDFMLDFRQQNRGFTGSPLAQGNQNTAYDTYRQNVQKTQAKLSTYATFGMVGAPLALETGASFAKNFGKLDLSKGLESFSAGVTEAGQLLSTFPNKLGVMLASTAGIKSFSDSLSIMVSGFGKQERAFDLASTKAEKMASAGNSVLETFERLRTATTDATVTLDEYQSLQTKYAKSLMELASIQPYGAGIVQKLAGAGTADEKRQIISQAIDAQSQAKGEAGIKMQLAQLIAQSSVFGIGYGENRRGGIFAATNPTDLLEKQSLLSATAVQMEQGAMNSDRLPKGFAERMKNFALTNEDVSSITREASKSPILEGLGKNSISQIMEQFGYEISKFKIPAGVSPDDWKKHIQSLNELTAKETSIRLKYNQELQNILQRGNILSNFALTSGAGIIESKYRADTFETFKQGQTNQLAGLTTSEIPMIIRRSQTKSQEIKDQMTRDLAVNTNKGARELSSTFGKTISEGLLAGLDATDAKTNAVLSLPIDKINARKYLDTRQTMFANNPSALIEAAKNPMTFAEKFLGKKNDVIGGGNGISSNLYDTIANKLNTAANGQQENIASILFETKQITEKGLNDIAQLNLEQIAAIKEARFQELAQGIKGIDELARGGARRARRELRRDEYIYGHSRSTIRRGEAARDLLNYIPSDQRDYNNPQIRGLYNTAQSGSSAAFNYIFRGSMLQNFANSDERSFARTFGNYKGVNTPAIGLGGAGFGAAATKGIDVSGLTTATTLAQQDLTNFAKSLENIGGSLEKFKQELQDVSASRTIEGNRYGNTNSNNVNSPTPPPASPWMDNLKQYGLPALNAIIQLAFIAAAFKRGGASGGGSAGGLGGLASTISPKLFGGGGKAGFFASTTGAFSRGMNEESFIGKGMSGQSAGSFQKMAFNLGSRTGRILAPISGITSEAGDTSKALTRGLRGGNFIGAEMAGQSAGALQSTAFKMGGGIRDLSMMANPFGGWKNAGAFGKFMRVGGVLGAGLGAYNSYDSFRRGDYSGGVVGLGTTALSFAGPVGLAGSIGVNAVQAGTNKYMGYRNQIGNEQGRSVSLDIQSRFMNKYGSQYMTAVKKGIDATDADKAFMETYERATGSSAFRTKGGVIQKQATDFFTSNKNLFLKNSVAPVGTFEKGGVLYGFNSNKSYSKIGNTGDANKDAEIRAYTQKHEAERERIMENLTRTTQGKQYLDSLNGRAENYAYDVTNKKFFPNQQVATTQAPAQAPSQKSPVQDVKIFAEPATVIVKLEGNDGTLLQTILTKLAFMETQVNALKGTPKPASVNQAISQ